ncbi:MAG: alpha/beta hydrolase [Verrucomicrobia bacterium]|nr:alpha/beta hydrolase [Verrucomicrobiota bacterium]MCH8513329.1 alpha/beta hydrolase [Kiritimatiellia bacterium]
MRKNKSVWILFRVGRFLVLLWAAIFVSGFFLANHMAFIPPSPSYGPDAAGLAFVNVTESERVAMLVFEHPEARFHVIHAHGNGEDIGQLRDVFETYRDLGVNVYAVDYRGYGQSDGRPGIGRAKADIRAVYDELTQVRGVDPADIILHGRSLGTAMILPLAAEVSVGGLILESAMINGFRTVIPPPLFPLDPIPNHRHIRKIDAPVLFIHGEEDGVIPVWHGRKLYDLAPEPKQAFWIPDVGHNDLIFTAWDAYWERIGEFLAEISEF